MCFLSSDGMCPLSGVLLRRLVADAALKGVSHVIVDEIHERGINEVRANSGLGRAVSVLRGMVMVLTGREVTVFWRW